MALELSEQIMATLMVVCLAAIAIGWAYYKDKTYMDELIEKWRTGFRDRALFERKVQRQLEKEETEKANEQIKRELQKERDDTTLTANNINNAYRHGLRIEFIGDYLTTLDYLKSLEKLEWGFFWDNFELEVKEYPDAKAAIEIFTLSLRQQWIGV